MLEKRYKTIEWILRISLFGEFLGHGLLAISVKESWIVYLKTVGFTEEAAKTIMPLIGSFDLFLAILVLIRPIRLALLWMVIWTISTSLIRPISGEGILEFVERSANMGVPFVLLYIRGFPKSLKELFD